MGYNMGHNNTGDRHGAPTAGKMHASERRCGSRGPSNERGTGTATARRPASSSAPARRRVRRGGGRRFAATAFASLAALKSDRARCLPMPRSTTIAPDGRASDLASRPPSARRGSSRDVRRASSSTALGLWGGFDKFLQPYGVSDRSGDRDEDEDEPKLLNALLPRLQTKEEKSRILEGFQRARLDEQLRLSKIKRLSKRNSKRGGEDDHDGGNGANDGHFSADDDEEASKMVDSFQRARLAEQLRLSKQSEERDDESGAASGGLIEGHHDERDESDADKEEAFRRALLEERLKIRRLHRQRQNFVSSSDFIEKAMMEYEEENNSLQVEEEGGSLQTMTMVEENEESDDANDDAEEGEDAEDAVIVGGASSSDDPNGGRVPSTGEKLPLVNQTEDASMGRPSDNAVASSGEELTAKQPSDKLEELWRIAAMAAASPSSIAHSKALAPTSGAPAGPSSLRNFLSTTYLPLPPREDASPFSLLIAPMAHLLSSLFLLGAAAFWSVMAVVDVIWNDIEGECSTRACWREASHVWRGCWSHVFLKASASIDSKAVASANRRDGSAIQSAVQQTIRALQTSAIATFLVAKCILMRAAKQSKYANECGEALTGALRYLVYASRSTKVAVTRTANSLMRSFRSSRNDGQNKEKVSLAFDDLQAWKGRLNPLPLLSEVKVKAARRFNRRSNQRSVREERRRLQSEETYQKKLRLLNLDRLQLERDRQDLAATREELERERRDLTTEGVNLIAWHSAAREAADALATAAGREKEEREEAGDATGGGRRRGRRRWRRWRLWRRGDGAR